jgi:hypothetical protein
MAPLLNKQSDENSSPSGFRRYTKYALGEIVLVVVGILIALQINDWYQERLDRQTESEYLMGTTSLAMILR